MRFDVRGERPAPEAVIVGMDDATLTAADARNVLDRRWHAQVIRRLKRAGAKTIAYDVQFTQPSESAEADNALIRDACRARAQRRAGHDRGRRERQDAIFGGGRGARVQPGRPANSNCSATTSAGVIRRMAFEIDGLETFPMAAARDSLVAGAIEPPPAAKPPGSTTAGPPGTSSRSASSTSSEGGSDAPTFRDKIVVVGASRPRSRTVTPTSTSQRRADGRTRDPGERNRHGAARTSRCDRAPHGSTSLLVVVLGAVAPLAALRISACRSPSARTSSRSAPCSSARSSPSRRHHRHHRLPRSRPAVAALLATGAIHAVTVAFERERTRDAFARFVPEAVVDRSSQRRRRRASAASGPRGR